MVNKINHGKLFEDRLEEGLIMLNLPYTREGSKRNYGVREAVLTTDYCSRWEGGM